MARKNKLLLHIGPHPERDGLHEAMTAEADLLEGADLAAAPVGQDAIELAAHEMLRTHRSVGLRRREVEGTWAGICRDIQKAKRDLVLTVPAFCAADDAQVALITDQLRGLDVHVVVTPEEGEDAEDLVAAWAGHLKPGRVHRAPLALDTEAVDLAEELVGLALCIEHAELDTRITKLKRRRKVVRGRLALREAS